MRTLSLINPHFLSANRAKACHHEGSLHYDSNERNARIGGLVAPADLLFVSSNHGKVVI